MDILEQIEELQEVLVDLRKLLAEAEPPEKRSRPSVVSCWACGGPTNASTMYGRYYCRQERGPCGVIRIFQSRGNKYDCVRLVPTNGHDALWRGRNKVGRSLA